MSLHLAKGKPRTLAYGSVLRDDLKLLEVSEELLQELQETGYGQSKSTLIHSFSATVYLLILK